MRIIIITYLCKRVVAIHIYNVHSEKHSVREVVNLISCNMIYHNIQTVKEYGYIQTDKIKSVNSLYSKPTNEKNLIISLLRN